MRKREVGGSKEGTTIKVNLMCDTVGERGVPRTRGLREKKGM